LPPIEYFGRGEVFEVLVIRKYLYLMRCSLAVSSPMFEGVDDCEEFLVVDFIVDFRGL